MTARPTLTVALCLPDGVTDPPQRRDDEEDGREVAVGHPDYEEDDEAEVKDTRDADDGLPGHVTGQEADQHGEERVGHAECDHIVADVLDT